MKVTNQLCAEYVALEEENKRIDKRLSEIKELLKEAGPCSTSDYIVSVENRSRRSLAGLKEVTDVVGLDILVKHALIKESSYQIVRVLTKLVRS